MWYDGMWYRTRGPIDGVVSDEKKEEAEKAVAKSKEVLSDWKKLESVMLSVFASEDEGMMLRHALQDRHQQVKEKVLDYALVKQNLIDRLAPI